MKEKIKIPLPPVGIQQTIADQEKSGLFFGLRIETRFPYDQGWKQPTPEEVRAILKKLDLTGSEAGKLVGVNGRTIRTWAADPDAKTAAKIPYAPWRLLILELDAIRLVRGG